MDDERVFIVARDYHEALFYARENRIVKGRLRYVSGRIDLDVVYGRGKELLVTQAAYLQRDYNYILEKARHLRFGIKFI